MEQFAPVKRSKDGQPVRYLIVDDSVFARKNLARMVESFGGHLAGEAGDGLTAITEYDRTHPDIVLMDITMPQMEGIEAAERIVQAHPDARIVMVSSVGYQENIVAALQRGARHFVQKPVKPEVLYEVIKYGVITSRGLFDRVAGSLKPLFNRDEASLLAIVKESSAIKARVVETDEREHGLRRILNFGHTAGHALEAVTKYKRFLHGEAVAFGMLVAAELGVGRGVMPSADRDALASLIANMGPLPAIADIHVADVLEAVGHDKKVIEGQLHFVMPKAIGTCEVVTDVTKEELAAALGAIGASA